MFSYQRVSLTACQSTETRAGFGRHLGSIWAGFRQHWAVLRQHLGRVWAAFRQQRAGFGQHLGTIGQY